MATDTYLQNTQIGPNSQTVTPAPVPPSVLGTTQTAATPSFAITSESLKPVQTVDIPTGQPATTPPITTNTADTILKATQVEDTATQKLGNDLSTKIYDLIPQLTGQAQTLATEQSKANLPQLKQDLQGINSQILKKQAEIAQDDITLIANSRAEERRDTLLPFANDAKAKLAGDAAILRALKTSEIGVLNATAIAKQGDIALAMETAKEAVDLKYAPYKEAIDTYTAQLKALEPILSKDEKKQAREQEIRGQLAMKEIDKAAQNDKAIQDAIIDGIANGAPSSVISKAKFAKTPTEAAQILGNYSTANLDAQIKRANLANVYSTIAERNAKAIADNNIANFVTPPVINPSTGKLDPTSQLASVIKSTGIKDNTNLQNILGVVAATQAFAEKNPSGDFAGLGIVRPGKLTIGPKGTANQSGIEAVNLKVQQWASGAALTEEQTKQVAKITPRVGDTDKIVKQKTNALADFMQNQARGLLASQGINYTPSPIDYFNENINTVSNEALLSTIPGSAPVDNKSFFNN